MIDIDARNGVFTLSRVADTLYWISRYLERAEHTARLVDLQLHLTLDQTLGSDEQRWERLLNSLHLKWAPGARGDAYKTTDYLTFDAAHAGSIMACIGAARENARHVREQISSEMWEQVNRLYFHVRSSTIEAIWNDQPHEFYRSVKEGVHLFQGITDSTMNRGEGWQFIQLGRSLERTASIARLLDVHFTHWRGIPFSATVSADFMEWIGLLKSCTAFEAYCKVYTADLRPDCIAEFLILNPDFPHSIRFCANHIYDALQAINQATESKRAKQVNRLAGRLRAALDYGNIAEMIAGGLHPALENIQEQCAQIHQAIYHTYITYPAEDFTS